MLDNLFTGNTPLLVFGIASTLIYIIRYIVLHGSADFEKAVGNACIIFPAGASIVGGVKVMIISFNAKVCDVTQVEQAYVCLGGLAILVASAFDVYRKIKDA